MNVISYDPSRTYDPSRSFLRIAAVSPRVRLADISANEEQITRLYHEAQKNGCALAVFPEMSITGYSIGDMVQNTELLDQSCASLLRLAAATQGNTCAMVACLPLRIRDVLYNCAVMLSGGAVRGIVPKINLPTYGEFYENRWFESYEGPLLHITLEEGGPLIPFGGNQLFDIDGVSVGIEICEDLWVCDTPSSSLAGAGALVIVNPSASPEQIGKEEYRRDMIKAHSGRLLCAYVYCGCASSESTAEVVMGAHRIIASSYSVVAEAKPFGGEEILMGEIDADHLRHDRRRQHMRLTHAHTLTDCFVKRTGTGLLVPPEPNPFLPEESAQARSARFEKAFTIQSVGLAERMRATRSGKLVVGLSGGLDSTLAVLVACRAAEILGLDKASMVTAITMPGPASSTRTQSNSVRLALALGVTNEVIPIAETVDSQLRAISHTSTTDVTYENTQARARTSILFNWANKHNAVVLGTGDLSELALGWCTYNGDQQSHYNVNASLPKTFIRALVEWLSLQDAFSGAREVITDILATPITPELVKEEGDAITQNTEDLVGPYELHDFFIHHFVRHADSPAKIGWLAKRAFEGVYPDDVIDKWLAVFFSRFRTSQFKRDTMPNGPKVGAVSLSPRGDWRMPSDMP